MNSQTYIREKHDFYANLTGTSFNEVLSLIISFPVINFLSLLVKYSISNSSFLKSFWSSFAIDYIFNFIPLICICTIFSSWFQSFLLCTSFVLFLVYPRLLRTSRNNHSSQPSGGECTADRQIILTSVSTFRTWLYLSTCVSILAVDFRLFPRRFAKTENYGISLMDMGVGIYIVCHAMKFIRWRNRRTSTYFASVCSELKNSSILIAFGLLRLVSVKLSGYVEHESEYGRHWNFFFTIVAVKLVASLLRFLTKECSVRSFLIGSAIACFYQYILSVKQLNRYIMRTQRDEQSLFDLNREGVSSCFGYLAIYLIAQSIFLRIDSIIKKSESNKSSRKYSACFECLLHLAAFSLLSWLIFEYSRSNIENVSRRMCNLSFISLNVMLSSVLLGLFLLTTLLVVKLQEFSSKEDNDREKTNSYQWNVIFSFSQIVDSKFIGLFIFLFSNIFTGLVNISMNTLSVSNFLAFVIICVYSLASFVVPLKIYRFINRV